MAMNGAGTTIAVGSSGHDGSNDAVNSGHVRVFDLDETGNWLLRGEAIEGEFEYDNSGTSVMFVCLILTKLVIGCYVAKRSRVNL